MIIQGKPELGLQKHQQEAYQAVKKAYENDNKACVVIPTGCGKSFVALQLMADNKDKRILFMAPTRAIRNQMYNYIAKYIVEEEPSHNRPTRMIAEEYFPNLKIMTYQSLLRVKDEQMKKINADVIIMDELHRTGADKWGERVNTLLEKNPNAQILGLTATPDRMDDKNVVDGLFDGNIAYELTLVEALRDRIVKSPDYVKCDYALGEHLEGIRIAISNCKDEETKKELQEKYDKMRRIVEHADGIPELFAKNIKKKDGKYIIFCKDKEHMEELMSKATEWFGDIDSEPEIYSVYSGEGYTDKSNQETIKKFESSKSNHIKLLYSIDMLNEGLHVEDISGVIMARPTDSRIIYLQQLGRILSSDSSRDKTIVFDLVNNYLRNNLDVEVNKRVSKGTKKGDKEKLDTGTRGIDTDKGIEDIDIFRIQGETKEFLELFEEIKGIVGLTSYLENARNIKAWIEKSGDTRPPNQHSKDSIERKLASAFNNIKQTLIKPYLALETEEERVSFRQKRPDFDEIKAIIDEINRNNVPINLVNARKIKKWIADSKKTTPPSKVSKNEEEKRLGDALGTIRQSWVKPYMSLETEEAREAFRTAHPEIIEIVNIVNEIDRNNISIHLANAREIKQWIDDSGDVNLPKLTAENEREKRLANALSTIRRNLINPYLELKTEQEKKAFIEKHPETEEVLAIINKIDSVVAPTLLLHARNIKTWMEQNEDTTVPPSQKSKDKEEKRLGQALSQIRVRLVKPYTQLKTDEERENFKKKHPETDEVMRIISEIDSNIVPPYLATARAIDTWVRRLEKFKYPVRYSEDEEEKKLASSLSNMRTKIIKPYMSLETEEAREAFRTAHPETDEVLSIISKLDMLCGNKRQQELAMLIKEDIEKRRILQEAKKLENDYMRQLLIKKGKVPEKNQEQGVDFDGQ